MRRVEQALDRLLDRGVLPLLPNYGRRLYMDGGRLPISRRPGDTYVHRARMWRPERGTGPTASVPKPDTTSHDPTIPLPLRSPQTTLTAVPLTVRLSMRK